MMLTKFRFYTLVTALSLAGIGTWLVAPTRARGGTSGDWLSHNYDLRNSRFSPVDQINTSNATDQALLNALDDLVVYECGRAGLAATDS